MLSKAVEKTKIGHSEKKEAIKSLHENAKRIEADFTPNDNFDKLIEKEWKESQQYGGRTVMDDAREGKSKPRRKPIDRQLRLF